MTHSFSSTDPHIPTSRGQPSMLLLQDVTTARPRLSDTTSSVSVARDRGKAHECIVDCAAERKRSKFRGLWQVVSLWRQRRKDRATLHSLSPRDIQDFCPRPIEVEVEMNKPFWRA